MSLTSAGHEEDETYDAWPALTDLLAASAMIFLVFFAVMVYDRMHERGEMQTLRKELVSRLRLVPNQSKLFTIGSDPQLVRITLQEDVTFPSSQYRFAQLKPEGRQALKEIGSILKEPGLAPLYEQVMVVGHTDQEPTGSDDFTNWELSAMRASAVARFLVQDAGIDPCRLAASGAGAYYPQVPPAGVADRPQNRRIEIMILPALAEQQNLGSSCYPDGDGTHSAAILR